MNNEQFNMGTKKLTILSMLATGLFLGSCGDPIPKIEMEQFMYLSLSGAREMPAIRKLNLENIADTAFYITMTYGGTTNYEQGDITGDISADYSLVEAFNAANRTAYLPLPEEAYAFDRMDALILNGKNISEPVKLTIRISALNLNDEYLLPVTVKSVSGGNLSLNEELKTLYLVFRAAEIDFRKNNWTINDKSDEWDNTNYAAANMIDWNKDTYWHTTPGFLGGSGLPQWVIIDLKERFTIHGVLLWNHDSEGSGCNPKEIEFEVSDNLEDWTTLLHEPQMSEAHEYELDLPAPSPQKGRYLKITIKSNWAADYGQGYDWSYIAEITLY